MHFIPNYFHLWHLPIVFLAGMIGEGYAVVVGSGGILIQFVLFSMGMPLPVVVATDIAGCLGSSVGAIIASPRNIWHNKKLLLTLGMPFFIGGIIGTIFLTKISPLILSYILIIGLIALLAYIIIGKISAPQALEKLNVAPKQFPVVGSTMLGLGLYANVSGVGAGTFQKIVFSSLLRMSVVDGIGIGNILYLPTTIFSFVVTTITGLIAWPYLITLWAGTFVGSYFVVRHIRKIPDEYLRKLLIVLTVLYLVYLIWSVVHVKG